MPPQVIITNARDYSVASGEQRYDLPPIRLKTKVNFSIRRGLRERLMFGADQKTATENSADSASGSIGKSINILSLSRMHHLDKNLKHRRLQILDRLRSNIQ